MKKIYSLILSVLLTTIIIAQAPGSFKYQAVLRDARGDIRANTSTSIVIDILQGAANGSLVYSENDKVTTDANGLININLGNGTATTGSIIGINWGAGVYFIKVTVDGVEMGTAQLLSVPYALYSNNAGNGFSGNYGDLRGKPILFDGTWSGLIGKPTLAAIATSGSYNDLTNKPILFNGAWTSLTGKPALALVATTGSYTNLTNQPLIFDGKWTSLTGKPTGNNMGDMLYWNGTVWAVIPVGQPGQYLQLTQSNIPSWTGAAYATITPTAISLITQTTAASGGNITNDGGANVTARGVCWSKEINPTISLSTKTTDGTGTGVFTSSITGLSAGTTYYVRAYATNSVGTLYGNQLSLLTLPLYPTEGLVGYYPFNGNANDLSAAQNNGIVVGAQLTTDKNGIANNAYLFDGTDNYIETTGGLAITNNFTISFWAYSQDATGYRNILNDGSSCCGGNDFLISFRGNDIGLRADKDAQLNFEDNSPSELQNLNLINRWVHVVWTMTPTSSTIYLDGTALITINEAGSDLGYHDAFSFIGARQVWGTPDNFFKGKLDEIRIYNRVLSDAEIQMLNSF